MFAGAQSQTSLDTQPRLAAVPGESERGQRVSRFSLRDDGPVPIQRSNNSSSASLRARQSEGSLRSAYTNDSNTPRPAYLTAFGSDMRADRSSVVSLQELEHGWGSNTAALNSSTADRGVPHGRAQTTRRPYRPPFAPNADLDEVPEQPALNLNSSSSNANVGNSPKRGRSLKERISGAINRSKSLDPASAKNNRSHPSPPAAAPARPAGPAHVNSSSTISSMNKGDQFDVDYFEVPHASNQRREQQNAAAAAAGKAASPSSPPGGQGASGVMRKLSRARTLGSHRRVQAPPPPPPPQEELDKILLYAAPPEAGIKHAPMLSSYAPRPPLRPRANTEGAATRLRPTPSISVGQARLAYAKSISRGNRTAVPSASRPDAAATQAPPSYRRAVGGGAASSSDSVNNPTAAAAAEEGLMMAPPRSRNSVSSTSNARRSRTSRTVPEGWATGERLLSTHEDDDRKEGAHVKFDAI